MIDGKIDDKEFRGLLKRVFKQELEELFKKHYGVSQEENRSLGIDDIRLPITDQLVSGKFVHNDPFALLGKPPYREV